MGTAKVCYGSERAPAPFSASVVEAMAAVATRVGAVRCVTTVRMKPFPKHCGYYHVFETPPKLGLAEIGRRFTTLASEIGRRSTPSLPASAAGALSFLIWQVAEWRYLAGPRWLASANATAAVVHVDAISGARRFDLAAPLIRLHAALALLALRQLLPDAAVMRPLRHRFATVSRPLCDRYVTVTPPFRHRFATVARPLRHRYATVSRPLRDRCAIVVRPLRWWHVWLRCEVAQGVPSHLWQVRMKARCC